MYAPPAIPTGIRMYSPRKSNNLFITLVSSVSSIQQLQNQKNKLQLVVWASLTVIAPRKPANQLRLKSLCPIMNLQSCKTENDRIHTNCSRNLKHLNFSSTFHVANGDVSADRKFPLVRKNYIQGDTTCLKGRCNKFFHTYILNA